MSNFNFNRVIIGGRLTAPPELKTTPNGIPVTSFTVAVTRRHPGRDGAEPEADFIGCVAWRQTAEFIAKYFAKGSSIALEGRLQVRSYLKDDEKRYVTEVVADEVYFVDSKSEGRTFDRGEKRGAAPPSPPHTVQRERTGPALPSRVYVPGPVSNGAKNSEKTSESDEPLIRDDELPF